MVNIKDLKVDHSYQRPEVGDKNTLSIARSFDWIAFGAIVVMKRDNGDLYVVDGQQRLSAAKRREDIKTVPCLIFQSNGRDHEAKAFIQLNINRSNVSSNAKYRAAVSAGINPQKEIDLWLKSIGMEVHLSGSVINGIDYPSILVAYWTQDKESSKKAIILQRQINGNSSCTSSIHKGLWYLLHNNIDVEKYVEKLQRLGGKSGILRSIKATEIELGQRESVYVCGMGVLSLINFKLKQGKITLTKKQ